MTALLTAQVEAVTKHFVYDILVANVGADHATATFSERGVQPGLLDDLPRHHPPAANLAREEEALLADALGKLADRIAEGSQCLYAHVLGGVDAETVDIGKGDPEAIGNHETRQCRGDVP